MPTTPHKKLLKLFLLWFIVINVFALISLNRYNLESDTAYTWINPTEFFQDKSQDFISIHANWDSDWYLSIAKNGYSLVQGRMSNIVFFPLYPTLIYIFSFRGLINQTLVGAAISVAALYLAISYLYKLVSEFHKKANPTRSVIMLLVFPTAFFLITVYTESLFLFLSVACFYYAMKGSYKKAGLFGLFAALTKLNGVFLFLPITYEYLKASNFEIKSLIKTKFIPILLIPLGTLMFLIFHWIKFGDPFLIFKVQQFWGRLSGFNWGHFDLSTETARVNFGIDVFFIVIGLLAAFYVLKRIRVSYGIYMLFGLLVPLATGTFMSIGRYLLVLFPVYILLASIKNKDLLYLWVFISILLLSLNITLFVNSYWAG